MSAEEIISAIIGFIALIGLLGLLFYFFYRTTENEIKFKSKISKTLDKLNDFLDKKNNE